MKRFFLFLVLGFVIGFLATYASIGSAARKPVEKTLLLITTPPPASSDIPEVFPTDSISSSGSGATNSGEIFGIGQFCGGVGKISCPPGLVCQKENGDSGFCQPR